MIPPRQYLPLEVHGYLGDASVADLTVDTDLKSIERDAEEQQRP